MNKLDDLKYIHSIDGSGALQIAAIPHEQLRTKFAPLNLNKQIQNVVFAAMGGSALAARISLDWPGFSVPFEIVTDYTLPKYVGPNTLVITSSYSGNTEETIAAFHAAKTKKAQVVAMSSGGALQTLATEHGVPYLQLPHATQPRYAVFYSFKALVDILEGAGLVDPNYAEQEVHSAADFIETAVKDWLVDVPTSKNLAKQLALEVAGTSPVIYASNTMFSAAYKWKISFNENAKNVAWCNTVPEMCHNEFIGWSSHPIEKAYSVIDLKSSFDHPRIAKRFEIMDRLLSGKRPAAHIVTAQGSSILQHLVWFITLGDFVSIYTALLNGLDPTPVNLVEKLKTELNA